MIIVIGEILIDRFPEYERIGGAPFNFAFHLKNMGWPVRFITRVGDDADGLKARRLIEENGFSTEDVQIDQTHDTGRVEVTLDGKGIPNFEIRKNVAYDHIDLSSVLTGRGIDAQMIYFGSLIQRTRYGFNQVQELLKQCRPATTRFCDINFRAPHINAEAIEPSLNHADILKLNDEELETISRTCNGPEQQTDAIDWLMQNHNISMIALTHGADGSTAFTKAQTTCGPLPKGADIKDTVGAGDAFAAVLAAGALVELPMDRTLELATGFATHMCGLPGAIPKNKEVYASMEKEFERIRNVQ
ncbi:MAG: PfkB family carbohydrate kinase [Desulfobacteraceae bacterium]|jgi:fructokinase